MAKEDSQLGRTDQRMQVPFMVKGAAGAPIERLLEMQASLLKEAEVFTRHWFERRNDAIATAIEALHRMNSTGTADPADALRAIAEWQRGSLERMSADAEEWTTLCMRGVAAASTVSVDAATQEADRAEANKANGKARPKAKAGHAMPV